MRNVFKVKEMGRMHNVVILSSMRVRLKKRAIALVSSATNKQ